MSRVMIAMAALMLTLGGCGQPSDEPIEASRAQLFEGDLASIDGRPIQGASVRIELWAEPGANTPAAYRIDTGCRLSGLSADGGRFHGAETLSPCSNIDVELIQRVEEILRGSSQLQWAEDGFAELSTAKGRVRFQSTAGSKQ